jgi:hypothetical protein
VDDSLTEIEESCIVQQKTGLEATVQVMTLWQRR